MTGDGDGDGVGADQRLEAEGGQDARAGIGQGPADHIFFQGKRGVVAGRAEVVRVADGDGARPDCGGLLHSEAHGIHACRMAQPTAGVNVRGRGRLPDDRHFAPGVVGAR